MEPQILARLAWGSGKSVQQEACCFLVSRLACMRKRVKYGSGAPNISSKGLTDETRKARLDLARVPEPRMADITSTCLAGASVAVSDL